MLGGLETYSSQPAFGIPLCLQSGRQRRLPGPVETLARGVFQREELVFPKAAAHAGDSCCFLDSGGGTGSWMETLPSRTDRVSLSGPWEARSTPDLHGRHV